MHFKMYIKDVLYISTWYNETKKNKYQKKIPKMNYGNLPFLGCICNLCMFNSTCDGQLGLDSYCYNNCLTCTKPQIWSQKYHQENREQKDKCLKSNYIYGTLFSFNPISSCNNDWHVMYIVVRFVINLGMVQLRRRIYKGDKVGARFYLRT